MSEVLVGGRPLLTRRVLLDGVVTEHVAPEWLVACFLGKGAGSGLRFPVCGSGPVRFYDPSDPVRLVDVQYFNVRLVSALGGVFLEFCDRASADLFPMLVRARS